MKSVNYFGYEVFENGKIKSLKYKKNIKFFMSNSGYYRKQITINNQRKNILLHRILAECFILNPENKPQVNHKNGIKIDNRIENLEWVTRSENQLHSVRTGLRIMPKGIDHKRSKVILQYDKSGIFIKEHHGLNDIARKMKINCGNISQVINKKRISAGGYIWVQK